MPWANFALCALFAMVALLMAIGLRRAFAPGPRRLLRVILSLVPAGLSAAVFAFFLSVVYVDAYKLPPSSGAPQVGQRAPDFTLLDVNGTLTSQSDWHRKPATAFTFLSDATLETIRRTTCSSSQERCRDRRRSSSIRLAQCSGGPSPRACS